MNKDWPDQMSELPSWMRDADLCQSVCDAVPLPRFVADEDMRLPSLNPEACSLAGKEMNAVLRRRGGEVFNCVHHTDSPLGLRACSGVRGMHPAQVRIGSREGREVARQRAGMKQVGGNAVQATEVVITAAPLHRNGQRLAPFIFEDIAEVTILRCLLPICANCKKGRDDRDYWQSVEKFFSAHLNVDFSHGIGPDCSCELYPDLVPRPPVH